MIFKFELQAGVEVGRDSVNRSGMRPVRSAPKLDKAGLERALDRLRQLVRERGLKASEVRENIAKAALTVEGHFSIDELMEALPEAHTATVYRVIPLLVDAGLLQAAPGPSDQGNRYERAFEREHHDHLVCTNCQKVVEFHFETIESLQRDVAERFGFALTGHVHQLFGTCASCQKKVSKTAR
jgi:Fur family ferric uptake transcriptional regulator